MKDTHADITMVLDRSGSMESVKEATITGVNTFLDDQRKAPGHASITLHQFDDVFETPIPTSDIKSARNLSGRTFVPRGSTALLDAIGRAIGETGSRLDNTPEHERAGKVIFVIVTDGHENASKEFTDSKIREMIEHQKNTYSWQFVFLGANIDAVSVAQNIGVSVDNAMTYSANKIGTEQAYACFSSNVRKFRGGQSVNMAWSAADKKKQKEAGA